MVEVFPLQPASAKPLLVLAGIAVALLLVAALLGWTAWSARHARVELEPGALHLVADLWSRRIPVDRIDAAGGRVVDLSLDTALRPRWRTWGAGLPGYQAGWFRLAGGEKALVLLTHRERVLYLPTRDGYALLLSVEQPELLLEAVRAGA